MVNGSWISSIFASIWWIIILVAASGAFLMFCWERKSRKNDQYTRLTHNGKYAERCGVSALMIKNGKVPSLSLFELYQLAQRSLPEFKVSLCQYHLTLKYDDKVAVIITLDSSIDQGYRYFDEVICLNYTSLPSRQQLTEDIKALFAVV